MDGGSTRKTAALLEPWQDFPMGKQGEYDYLCGVYCVLAAAEGLGTKTSSTSLHPLNVKGMKARWLSQGLTAGELHTLANSCGLTLGASPNGGLEIVFLRMDFEPPPPPPPPRYEAYSADHFVLVLARKGGLAVIADPHPWHPRVYTVPAKTFAGWQRRSLTMPYASYSAQKSWRGYLTAAT